MPKRAGGGSSRPPENGFQVKIRLSYPFRDLSFSGLFGAFGGKPLVEQRRCSDEKQHRCGCVAHLILFFVCFAKHVGVASYRPGALAGGLAGSLARGLPRVLPGISVAESQLLIQVMPIMI